MRILMGLAGGLFVAVILIEAGSRGLSLLLPPTALYAPGADGFADRVVWPLLPAPALLWLAGGLAGGAMAAAASSRPVTGLGVGVLLALPAFTLVGLITPGDAQVFLAAALPLAGSAAGSLLVLRLGGGHEGEEVTASDDGQAV